MHTRVTCRQRLTSFTRALSIPSAILLAASLPSCGSNGSTEPDPNDEPTTPSVTITQPSDGATVSGTVTVSVTAERTDRVRFSVDGELAATDEEAPFVFEWDTTGDTDGAHTVTARGEATARTGAMGNVLRAESQTISVTVDNDGEAVAVTVTPPDATVRVNETQTLSASVTGSANDDVTWSVDGGAANGTIDASGLYTAPAQVPSPATVTVRATSAADPSASGTASVTIIEDGLTTDEQTLLNHAFGTGTSAASISLDAIDTAVEGVFVASQLAGDENGRFFGTLTEGPGETFTYSPTPNDRLVIDLLALNVPIEIVYSAFIGFVDGTWEDFRDSHDNLAFQISIEGVGDLSIASIATARLPDSELRAWVGATDARGLAATGRTREGRAARRTFTSYARTLAGSIVYANVPLTVDLELETGIEFETSGTFTVYDTDKSATGTITTPTAMITVAEQYQYKSIFGDNFVQNWHLWNASSVAFEGTTYAYQDVYVRGEFTNGGVGQPDFWIAEGALMQDGVPIGVVRYDAQVISGTRGPDPEIALASGETVPLESIALD